MYVASVLRRTAGLALAVVLIGRTALPASAQQEGAVSQGSAPTVVVNARLVVLDVVVTDKNGKPVEGLTEKDFQVFEDGQPQRIRSLEPPSAHALPEATASAGVAEVFDAAQPANFGHSPVVVLVLDQLNTHFTDSSFARRELRDYLLKQPALLAQPTTLLTVYDNNFKQLFPFSRDRDALLKALAAAPTKYAWKLESSGNTEWGPFERTEASLRALEQIAQSYARIPGRKNLVWVGGGFPTIDPTSVDGNDAVEIKNTIQHVTDVLLDTRVTMYAIDPTSTVAGMTEITDSTQMDVAAANGDAMLSLGSDPFSTDEDFDKLGPVTGGRVIRGRNDVAQYIASSVDLGTNYYTLSYSPSSALETAAKYRKIRVVCLRPGLTATTRSGYYPGKAQQETTKATASYDLSTAAEGRMQLNGLKVHARPDGAATLHRYVISVAAGDLTWSPNVDGGSLASVYVMAVLYDKKGKIVDHAVHPMKAVAKAGTDLRDPAREADFAFVAPDISKGATLRFVVRDSSTGRMGSVEVPVSER